MTTIIFLVIGFLIGILVRPLLTFHKHDWEIVWHDHLDTLDKITVAYSVTDAEKEIGFQLSAKDIKGTYKRCRKCKQCDISFKAMNRIVSFDFDVVKAQLDAHIQKQKEKEDQALIESVNKRIGLTSPEVPYNPAHAKQTTPQ